MSSFLVMLAVHNGQQFLAEQLKSIEAQGVERIDFLVSDDQSTDGSASIIQSFAAEWSRGSVSLQDGPGLGFAENFRSLILNAPSDRDFYAFCDQDDLWDADKLARAEAKIRACDQAKPVLYCGRTRLIDENGKIFGQSPLMKHRVSFENALVQSIAGANTMVMNLAAFELLKAASRTTGFVSHDWWSYLLVTGAGGNVIYDPVPAISYRQHGTNVVGSNTGLKARVKRLRRLLDGSFVAWTEQNLSGLHANAHMLSAGNRKTLERFSNARMSGGLAYLTTVLSTGIRRQTLLGNLSLFAGAVLGRI